MSEQSMFKESILKLRMNTIHQVTSEAEYV
jgi:hypothetical protein